jgi:Uma2 family endonuclease
MIVASLLCSGVPLAIAKISPSKNSWRSTESFDREGKFKHYRSIPSLQEHVLVSYREPLIESHVRNADGSWNTTFAGPGEALVLRSIDSRLEVDAIYSGTREGGRMLLP